LAKFYERSGALFPLPNKHVGRRIQAARNDLEDIHLHRAILAGIPGCHEIDVERIQNAHLIFAEFEAINVQILGHAPRICGLGQGNEPPLDAPPQQDLGGGRPQLPGDFHHLCLADLGGRALAQRGVCLSTLEFTSALLSSLSWGDLGKGALIALIETVQ